MAKFVLMSTAATCPKIFLRRSWLSGRPGSGSQGGRGRYGRSLRRYGDHCIRSGGTPSEGAGPDPATGYTVIEAADLHDAIMKAKGCPWLSNFGSVRLCEAIPMG